MRKKKMRQILRQAAPWALQEKKEPGVIAKRVKNIRAALGKIRRHRADERLWPKYGARARKWKHPGRVDGRVLKLAKNGITGMQLHQINTYLDRVIGEKFGVPVAKKGKVLGKKFSAWKMGQTFKTDPKTGEIIIHKSFEFVPIGMALRRAFASIELPGKPKRARVGQIINRLHSEGKISFKETTEAVFSEEAKKKIRKILAPRGDEFMDYFSEYLQDSTNWVKDYLHRKMGRVVKEPWDKKVEDLPYW